MSLENTHDGKATPIDRMEASAGAARDAGLLVHLDGARFFNAVTALGCAPLDLAGVADSVPTCLSKGLGTPCGSILVGSADLIQRAQRWRKMLGGGMRQSGMLAAAGLYALEHNIARLGEGHMRAARLGQAISAYGPVEQNTNMVFFTPPEGQYDAFRTHLAARACGLAVAMARFAWWCIKTSMMWLSKLQSMGSGHFSASAKLSGIKCACAVGPRWGDPPMSIDKDLSDRPMEGPAPGDSFGKEGVPAHLTKALAEPAVRVALDEHLAEALPEDAKPAIETAQRVQPEDGHDRER